MGNFFTSSQIFNGEGLDKQQFIDKFCKAMADSGYVVCDSDEGEKSYILRFDADSKWVAIASEEYAQNSDAAKSDTGRIAKMLGTYCMNTEVIDSDCAAMSLYGKDGKSADMLLMGRYDDYFGDDNPEPNKKIWSQFLSGGSTWEQFKEILGGEYVFVEDGLSQLAPVIGMDSGNLLFSAEHDADDEMAVFLDFKKAGTKKEKKLTLKSAFVKVFGEALEPMGFVKLKKTKEPCYIRIVGDGIIDVITYRTLSAYKTGYKNVEIRIGILSLYNPELIFLNNPTFSLYCIHTLYFSDYYRELGIVPRNETIDNVIDFECELWDINKNNFSDPKVRKSEFDNRIGNCLCSTSDSGKLLRVLNNTCGVIKDVVLPIMEKIKDNREYIEYCYSLRRDLKLSTDINEFREITRKDGNGLLLIKENYTADTSKYTERDLAMYVDDIEHGRYGLGDATNIEDFKKKFRDNCQQQKEICKTILNTPKLRQVFLEELESYKDKNMTTLTAYGIK